VLLGVTDIRALLDAVVASQGSDLHLKVGSPPRVRVNGRLSRLETDALDRETMERLLEEVIRPGLFEEFERVGEADFAYSLSGVGRFRVNAFRQRGTIGMVMRRVQIGATSAEELGLPAVIGRLADEPRGLVLVTGPTGSGKTTTLAAMIDRINSSKESHIITIEDPIEVLHADKLGMVNQREVRVDTRDFPAAMRAAMRQDPDVILVGEMRDTETVGAGLAAAETGHLVLSTLHTTDAAETVNRCIDFFPPFQQKQVRLALASSLRGVVSQRLVRRADGQGRVAVLEVMVNTGRVAEAIADLERTAELPEIIAEGAFYGMQTFDQHLVALFRDSTVSLDDAVAASSNPHDFRLSLQNQGLIA
jgi:twitching motility protein PilT